MTFGSILPKALEPVRAQFRIAHRVRDVLVPQVLLDRARVLTLAGELEPTGMPQHVRMDGEGELRELAGARSSTPRIGWVEATPFFNRLTCIDPALKSI